MTKPLVAAFVLFMAGIIFAGYVPLSFIFIISLIILLFLLSLFFRKKRGVVFYVLSATLIFLLGSAAYINFNTLGPYHISHLLKEKQQKCYLQGVIASPPDYSMTRWGRRRASFTLSALGYKKGGSWIKIEGLSKVNVNNSDREYSYGDNMVFVGTIKKPISASNPGQFDYAGYLRIGRIYTVIDIGSDDDIILLERPHPGFIKRFIYYTRENMARLIEKYLPGQDASVLNAMLLGERSSISRELNDYFIKTGTAHILSVSGLHVTVISAIIFFILRFLSVPKRASSILVIGFLIIYTILTEARAPIVRSAVMISVFISGYILERDFDVYSALSLAGILILVANPMQLFDVGFCLSFACIFSMCYFTPIFEGLFNLKSGNIIITYILKTALASLAVSIGVMPMIAHYFNIISPVTILANMFIVPLSGVILFLGMLFVASGSLLNPLAVFLANLLHIIFLLLIKIMVLFSNMPFAYFYVPDIPLYAIIVYYIFILLLVKQKTFRLNPARTLMIGLFVAVIFAGKALFAQPEQLRVGFLDLGGENSIFLEFPDGKTVLVDAGKRRGPYADKGRDIVAPFIWSRGRRGVDVFLLTRNDATYQGAAVSVFERANAGYFISSGLSSDNKFYQSLKNILTLKKIKAIDIKDDIEIRGLNDARILVVKPRYANSDSRMGAKAGAPLIVKLTYKDISFIFYPAFTAVINKISDAVKPELIVVNGRDKEGFNDKEAMAEGASVVKTSDSGAITITTDGHSYSVKSFKGRQFSCSIGKYAPAEHR